MKTDFVTAISCFFPLSIPNSLVPIFWYSGFTKHIPSPFLRTGLKVPDEINPTFSPFSFWISESDLRIPLPWTINPTLFYAAPIFLILVRASLPWNLLTWLATLNFLTSHMSDVSRGFILSFISWPCRHKPASTRSESLAPKPAGLTIGFLNNRSVSFSILSQSADNSKPSSPVYPHLQSPIYRFSGLIFIGIIFRK